MNWMQALCETYDNYFAGPPLTDGAPLVPVGFIEKELSIRVNLLADGSFHSASVLAEKEKLAVPSSPLAEGRTGSTPAPYPLCEELRYVAGDLSNYTDGDFSAYYNAYIGQLRDWVTAADAAPALASLLSYLEQERVVTDLIACGLLTMDEDDRLLDKWPGKKDKPAFYALNVAPAKSGVDFALQQGAAFIPLRQMQEVQKSWQSFLLATLPGRQLCYASGQQEAVVYNHAKIEGNAKLISAKDGPRDFQYKGRFTTMEQVYSVSYTASAKAHNTLRWLRERQGFRRYGNTFIAWSPSCRPIIKPQDEPGEGWGEADEEEVKPYPQTEQAYAERLRLAMSGFAAAPQYAPASAIVMLGMEAATTGRMSINYYQELDGKTYLQRLNAWYEHCYWLLLRKKPEDGRYTSYVSTPNLYELGEAVFGAANMIIAARDIKADKAITKQVRSFNADILSCIVNGRRVPLNAARAAFRRACRPESFVNSKGKWQRQDWLRCLAVACAMQKSYYIKEEYTLDIKTSNPDTSLLFGRLTAVADCVEIEAMAGSDTPHRQTNAIRYFSAMQQRPATTWQALLIRLQPYLTKLQARSYPRSVYYRKLIDKISTSFADGEIANNSKLTPHFLEGYHNQRYEILNKKER